MKVKFGNKVMVGLTVWSMEGVIVYGQASEIHSTFMKGELHFVWYEPYIDQRTL